MTKKKSKSPNTIMQNKKATFDFFIEEKFEAGVSLMGWEVKSLRAGRGQLKESYVILDKNEVWLFGAHISPLVSASTHVVADPVRRRKLLLHRREINRLVGSIDRKGYTAVALSMYWKNGKIKLQIGLAKGKHQFDKRATEKQRDWQREKQRTLKNH